MNEWINEWEKKHTHSTAASITATERARERGRADKIKRVPLHVSIVSQTPHIVHHLCIGNRPSIVFHAKCVCMCLCLCLCMQPQAQQIMKNEIIVCRMFCGQCIFGIHFRLSPNRIARWIHSKQQQRNKASHTFCRLFAFKFHPHFVYTLNRKRKRERERKEKKNGF